MNRDDLATLDKPRFLLYPNLWGYRAVILMPAAVFVVLLPWFIGAAVSGETDLWHWIFIGFLGLLSFGALRPKSWDWRQMINFAADTSGVYFVTEADGNQVVFVPWNRVGTVRKGSVRGSSGTIYGIIFEVNVDDEQWKALRGSMPLYEQEPDQQGYREIGISSNFRRSGYVLQRIRSLRPTAGGS